MLDIPTHKNILIRILKEIYSQSEVGPVLGFKGGTCAYLFYGLPRFSVDLDFDLLRKEKEEEIFKKLSLITEKFGKIKNSFIKRHTLFFLISYDTKGQNIKIEISRRPSLAEYKLENFLGLPMLIMKREDMFAYKLAALLSRRKPANRDIFDLWFFLNKNWPLNKELLEERVEMPWLVYFKKCLGFIEKLSEKRHILNGMGELLDEKQKHWAKSHLLKDTIFLLKARLESEKTL